MSTRIFLARSYWGSRVSQVLDLWFETCFWIWSLFGLFINQMRMFHALGILGSFALTSLFASTVMVFEAIIFSHILIYLCFKFANHHLHLCPFQIKLSRLSFSLLLNLQKLIINEAMLIILISFYQLCLTFYRTSLYLLQL